MRNIHNDIKGIENHTTSNASGSSREGEGHVEDGRFEGRWIPKVGLFFVEVEVPPFNLDATKGLESKDRQGFFFKDFRMNQAENMKMISHESLSSTNGLKLVSDLSKMILCSEGAPKGRVHLQVPPQ